MAKTVLFVHGLESGPRGRKAQHLAQAGFDVVSEQMPCGRARVVRDPVVLGAAALAVGVLIASTLRKGLFGLALSVCGVAAAKPFASSQLMRRVLRRSVAVQTRALASKRIDAVVASSFGGAVALELLASGAWSGPTVLLCPAHTLVAKRARRASPPGLASLPDAVSSRIVVVHGRHDEIVPVADSEALVAGSRARLVLVEDDHRLSRTATPERLAAWIALTDGTTN